MTRHEYLKNASIEDAAKFICNIVSQMDIVTVCDECPATNYCHKGHNGFNDWLKQEVKEYETD